MLILAMAAWPSYLGIWLRILEDIFTHALPALLEKFGRISLSLTDDAIAKLYLT